MYDSFYKVVFPQPEIWKDITGHEGFYQISSLGAVKSLQRVIPWVSKEGKSGNKYVSERILKPKTDKDGYHEYCLAKQGQNTHRRSHRLVAEAFIPSLVDTATMVVDHKDAIKCHNAHYNLQWMTSEENTIKYYAEEFKKTKTISSLRREDWLVIGERYNQGMMYKDICKELGIDTKNPESLWEGLSARRLSSVTGFKKGDYVKRPHPVQKLSDAAVLEILHKRLELKSPLKVLSKEYGITESMISRFCSGSRRPEILIRFKKQQQGKNSGIYL